MSDAATQATPNKQLALPDGPRTLAFRAVEHVLRSDPVLAAVVKSWRSREGQSYDADFADPGYDDCPMIALSPIPKPDEVLTIDSSKVNFAVAVEVCTPGTCVDDALNLWDAVCDALIDAKPFGATTVGKYLSCGVPGVAIHRLRAFEPAFLSRLPLVAPAGPSEPDPAVTWGIGNLTMFFQRRS